MNIEVTVDDTRVVAMLTNASEKVTKALVEGAVVVGLGMLASLKGFAHSLVSERTGNLARATFYRVEASGDGATVFVGGDLVKAKYFRLQDKGGVVTPKHGQYLTIPIGEAMTEKGVARFTARDVIAAPDRYGFEDTFFRNGIIYGREKDGEIKPLFVLKRSVTIKPVGMLAATIADKKEWAVKTIERKVMEAFNAGG